MLSGYWMLNVCDVSTRPDLCATSNILSRFQNYNNQYSRNCIKYVLRHIKDTIDMKLHFKQNHTTLILCGYSDFLTLIGEAIKFRENELQAMFLNFTCTRRQNTVALFSTEAEYMALTETI